MTFLRNFRLFLFLLFSISILGFQPKEKVVLKSVKIGDIVTIKVPENFIKLNDDQMADKIIASRKPLGMFSSLSGTADLSVSVANSARNPWEDKDLAMMAAFQKANIKALFTSVEFIQEKTVKINGQSFALFEFVSEVKEKGKPPIRKYNYLQYTIRKKNVMVFSFICSEMERPLYEGVAEEIMKSVRF